MTVDELNAELALVNTAIADALKVGTSYNKPGFSRTSASLPDLREQRDSLLRKIDRLTNGVASVVQHGPTSSGPDQFFITDENS